MAGFDIDARIPRGDFGEIMSMLKHRLLHWSGGTRPFVTEDGMLGTGYAGTQAGDMVCILYGSPMPQILRPSHDEGHYNLIGACHVDGIMFGEGLEMGLAERDFVLL